MPAPSEDFFAAVAPYVTNLDRDVYCVHGLPPEVTAVLFAYVSRSPLSFRENLARLLVGGQLEGIQPASVGTAEPASDEEFERAARRARAFHSKWVVGYGHASVAEHADLKFAIDALSILACKELEDNRLAGYTEKSTRYQVFDTDAFVRPPEFDSGSARALVDGLAQRLFRLYDELQTPLESWVAERYPQAEDVSTGAWKRAVNAKVCDIIRYILPAGTRTAVGVSMNARAASHAISKLLSSPLGECRALGEQMLAEGRKLCPTLLRYAGENTYLRDTPARLRELAERLVAASGDATEDGPVRLLHHDRDGEARVLAALLYGGTRCDAAALEARVGALSDADKDDIVAASLEGRGTHDWPPRALEATAYTMEITCDYGAFRDIQRHRMATQLHPLLDISLGYETPPELEEAGVEGAFHAAMEAAETAWRELAEVSPQAAQYVVPLAYRRRTYFTWNLREIEHFVRLRSSRQGHRSYRDVAIAVADAVAAVHPRLAGFLTVDRAEYDLERLAAEERAEIARRKK